MFLSHREVHFELSTQGDCIGVTALKKQGTIKKGIYKKNKKAMTKRRERELEGGREEARVGVFSPGHKHFVVTAHRGTTFRIDSVISQAPETLTLINPSQFHSELLKLQQIPHEAKNHHTA